MKHEKYEQLFINRRDAYQQQMPDGSYRCRRRPVDEKLVENHLRGRVTCGWYAINQLGRTKWACLDADREDGVATLQRAHRQLTRIGLSSYVEESRNGRGHLWVFSPPIEPKPLRTILSRLASEGVEVFPKQDRIGRRNLGSAVRGPLGVHLRSGKRYGFLEPDTLDRVGSTMAEQLSYLDTVQVNTGTAIAEALAEMVACRKPEPPPTAQGAFDVVEMARRFTELEDRGTYYTGLCPLHPEEHHSFAVYPNPGGIGRWVCFHDGVSGDAISLYAKVKGIEYRDAVDELGR